MTHQDPTIASPVSKGFIRKLISQSSIKSCILGPLLACLLKLHLDDLIPVTTKIVTGSLSSASVPELFKHAIVNPLLKKTLVSMLSA